MGQIYSTTWRRDTHGVHSTKAVEYDYTVAHMRTCNTQYHRLLTEDKNDHCTARVINERHGLLKGPLSQESLYGVKGSIH